eukprot:scaffold1943_cov109-Skeletonema_marinoi.AAC.1
MAAWVLTAALITDLARESSSHSPEQASQSTTAAAAATDAAKASILPESNSTRTDTDENTTELLHFDSYFAPVTISHLVGTHQRQFQLGVRDKPRI